MTVEYKYDNPDGGEFDIDPEDFADMTAEEISDELHRKAKIRARAEANAYVPELDDYVAEIMAANEEAEEEDEA